MKRFAGIAIPLLSLLSGCIGTKLQIPKHRMPQKFENQKTAVQTEQELATWWDQFNDPVLNELIKKAIANNYSLAIAFEQIEQARELYNFKTAQLLPQLDGTGQVTQTKVSTVLAQTSFLPKDRISFFQLGFDGSWEIDFWGKIWRAKNARYFTWQAQIEKMHDIYLILLADVARTYVDLCALNRIILLVDRQIALNERLVYLQKDLFDAGLTSKIELVQQQQQLAQSHDLFEGLIADRIQLKNRLAILLGSNPEEIAVPDRDTVPFSCTQLTTGIPSELLRRRPDIRQKERELAAANELVGQALAEWFPSLVLLGGIASETSQGSEWLSTKSLTWNIGPSFRWPLINFGRIKAIIKERESQKRQAVLSYSQTIIEALQEVENFLIAYFQNQEQREAIILKKHQAIEEVQLQQAKLHSGLASELIYLTADLNAVDVTIQETRLAQSVSTNLISLYKALGGGW